MRGKLRSTKYQGNREEVVLKLVREYPLYSLNRLDQKLPDLSRRKIQEILEKNELSTLEQRLKYSEETKLLSRFGSKIRDKLANLTSIRQLITSRISKPHLSWRLAVIVVVLLSLGLGGWFSLDLLAGSNPRITISHPEAGGSNQGESLFVRGRVEPRNSRVRVNGEEVALNGDGTFTAVIAIPMGESVLTVQASKLGKKALLKYPVVRVPTEEEKLAIEDEEKNKHQKVIDKVAQLDRVVNDLYAARAANEKNGTGRLRVLNNKLEENEGFYQVVGEVANLGDREVAWVMVTVDFILNTGTVVDTKHGFATDFEEVLKPGERKSFTTQATTQEFDYYQLTVAGDEEFPQIAGAATESAKIATSSAELD